MRWEKLRRVPDYEVSECGEVRRIEDKQEKMLEITEKGYSKVKFKKSIKVNEEGESEVVYNKSYFVHVLVCETFNIERKPSNAKNLDVDHIDVNPRNNYYKNLRWVTRSMNLLNTKKRNTLYRGVRYERKNDKWVAYIRHLKTGNVAVRKFGPLEKDDAYDWLERNLELYKHKDNEITYIGKATTESIETLTEDNYYPKNTTNAKIYFDVNLNRYVAERYIDGLKKFKTFKKSQKEPAYAWVFKEEYRRIKKRPHERKLLNMRKSHCVKIRKNKKNTDERENKKFVDESENKTLIENSEFPRLKQQFEVLNNDESENKQSNKIKRDQESSESRSSIRYNKRGKKVWYINI